MWGSPNPSYWEGTRPREVHRISTSGTELLHLGIAFLVLTFDIVLLQVGPGRATFTASTATLEYALSFGAVAALTGFLLHELAHKIAAQRMGLWAEFRASSVGLVLSVVTAGLGFLFAAPGATVVDGFGNLREWGRISLAGPAVNLVFGGGFLAASFALGQVSGQGFAAYAFGLLAFVNGWFAAFNLLPIGPLDGNKVWRWGKTKWIIAFGLAAGLAVYAYVRLFVVVLS